MSDLRVTPVESRGDLDAFIRLPFHLHRDDPNWVPPLLAERRAALDPKRNPFLRRAAVRFWLARRGATVVGRISAQIDPLVAEMRGPGEGHFGMVAAEDDPAVFAALTAAAEAWLAERGTRRVVGPFNLSINEESGLLVSGADTPPMLLTGHDLPYVAGRLEECGYVKARDLLAYLVETDVPPPPALSRLMDRPLTKDVVVRPLRMADYAEDVAALAAIFNDAWRENWGFVPLAGDEIEAMARQLRPLIRARLVWFAEVRGEPAAFVVCLPNVNEAIADLGGRLVPFGWAKLLWRLKVRGLKTARVPLMGVRRKFAGSVLGSLLPLLVIERARREALALGFSRIELSWVLEDNVPMRRLADRSGGRVYKTYRLYEKTL